MFGLATQIWCTFLGVNLLLQMKFFWKDDQCREVMPKYHAIAWGIPFILATLPAAQDFMVPLGTWCWITPEKPGWRLWAMYAPLWINFGINICIICMIIRFLRKVLRSLPEGMIDVDKMKRHYRFITCWTLMFATAGMVCWSISTIIRIMQAFGVDDIPFELYFFQALLLPGQGIFNLLVYVVPVYLQKFCCQSVYSDTKDHPIPACEEMGDDIPEVEFSTYNMSKSDDSDKPKIDHQVRNRYSNLKRATTFQQFQMVNKRITFYDGPGRIPVDIVRRGLSEHSEPTSGENL